MSVAVRSSVRELRRQAKRWIDELPPELLQVANCFLAFLDEHENDSATRELLRIPGLDKALRRAEEDIAAGRVTPVARLRRKY